MNRKNRSGLFISTILALTVFAGCNTVKPEPVVYEPIVLKTSDLTISLEYLDEATIEVRHGRNDARLYKNPYYGFPSVITRKNFYVFNMVASTSESTVNFRLDDINFRKGPVEGDAKSHKYLTRIWSYYNGGQSRTMEQTLDDTLLPTEFTVSPGEPVSGYLAFAEKYPAEGTDGTISFYLTTPGGESGRLEKKVYFVEEGIVADRPENTGIFADESE